MYYIEEIANWLKIHNSEHLLAHLNNKEIVKANRKPIPNNAEFLSFKRYIHLMDSGQDRGSFFYADAKYYYGFAGSFLELEDIEDLKELVYTKIIKLPKMEKQYKYNLKN